jgi:hypothetical protein
VTDPADQTCPACGQSTKANPRYPNYVCSDCMEHIVALDGRPIHFTNCNVGECPPEMSVLGSYADTGEIYACDRCLIGSLVCQAKEARFGGIVIQPVGTWIATGQGPYRTVG